MSCSVTPAPSCQLASASAQMRWITARKYARSSQTFTAASRIPRAWNPNSFAPSSRPAAVPPEPHAYTTVTGAAGVAMPARSSTSSRAARM